MFGFNAEDQVLRESTRIFKAKDFLEWFIWILLSEYLKINALSLTLSNTHSGIWG